jgi:hypothetical protein
MAVPATHAAWLWDQNQDKIDILAVERGLTAATSAAS